MNLTAPSLREHADAVDLDRVRARSSVEALVPVALTVWVVVLAALTWGTWGDPSMDTGYDLVASARTADGQLPYMDYVYWYGPLSPLLLGAVYSVVGAAIWPAVALGLILAVSAIALTYRLAREFAGALGAGAAAAIVAPAALSSANNSFVLPHATGAPLGVVLTLGAVLALVAWCRRNGGDRSLVMAGALCGLVSLTRPELAVTLYVALAVWLGLRVVRAADGERSAAVRAAALLAAPALALPALVYGFFAWQVGLDELLFTNLYPREFMEAAGSVIYELHAPLTAGSFMELAGRALAYAIGAAALAAVGTAAATGSLRGRFVTAGAASAGLLLLAVLAVRPETLRYYLEFAWMWLPAGFSAAAFGLAWRARREAADDGILLLSLVLALGTLSTYASFRPFPNALHPDATAYLLPLAAPWLAWLHTTALARGNAGSRALGAYWLLLLAVASAGLALKDARAETFTVRGPGGTLTARPADGPALQAAVDAIDRNTRPGDRILVAPQLSAIPILADRPTVLRQLTLLPGSLATPADNARAIRTLGTVRLAITDRTPLTLYEHRAFGTTFGRELAAAIRQHLPAVETVRGSGASPRTLDVWTRSSP